MPRNVGEVRLDPFDPARDADLVAAWMRAPHVTRWWGDSEQALGEVLERLSGGGDALVVADGVPVGYIRWQIPTRAALDAAGLREVPDGTMDIDIAIGEPDYVGLGVGPRALRRLAEELLGDSLSHMIMLATSVDNEAAIRAHEKVGFAPRRSFDDPQCGECWLLVPEVPAG